MFVKTGLGVKLICIIDKACRASTQRAESVLHFSIPADDGLLLRNKQNKRVKCALLDLPTQLQCRTDSNSE